MKRPKTKRKIDTSTTKSIQIDQALYDQFSVGLRRWRFDNGASGDPTVLAIDIGKKSTGWCYFADDGDTISNEGPPDKMVREIKSLIVARGAPAIFAREGPYTLSLAQLVAMAQKQKDARKRGGAIITPLSIFRLGEAAGFVTGPIADDVGYSFTGHHRCIFWEPPAMSWRSVVELNRQATDETSAREETAQAVLEYARRKTGLALGTDKDPSIDQANAICIAYAATLVALAVEAKDRAG